MVSDWRSVIAVSLNVGGGVRLIEPAKLYTCTQNTKHNEDGRTAPGVCGDGFVPLSHSGNVVTRMGIHTHIAVNNSRPFDNLRCCLYTNMQVGCTVDSHNFQ